MSGSLSHNHAAADADSDSANAYVYADSYADADATEDASDQAGDAQTGPTAPRVLFLGLDGGTQELLVAARDRGWMPNLSAFWRSAASGSLRSSDPMITPVAWTSFLTGCSPPTHGIHEFYYVSPEDGTIRPNHAGRVRVPTLWEVISARGAEVVSLNLPMTYPPPAVRGIVVGGSDAPGMDWAFAQCPDFGAEIRREIPDFTHKVVWKRRPRTLDELKHVADRTRKLFLAQAYAALRADERTPDWSTLMVHFHNLDGLLHRVWPELDLDGGELPDPAWHREVVSCLKALDDSIGILLELATKRDAAVLALSDHGFGRCRALVNVNGLLRQAGLQRGPGWGTAVGYRAWRLGDKARRWWARRGPEAAGRRLPRAIAGRVDCDWSRTQAFAPFGQLSGCIVLTPHVRADSRRAGRVIQDILAACRNAVDPITQLPVFADVFAVADRYGLDPTAHGLPDVMALSTDGYQAQAKWGRDSHIIRPDPNLPATHRLQGIVAVHGPGIRPGEHLRARLEDIAPTALAFLGMAVPRFMEGRILHDAFESPLAVSYGENPRLRPPAWSEAVLAAAGFGAECV